MKLMELISNGNSEHAAPSVGKQVILENKKSSDLLSMSAVALNRSNYLFFLAMCAPKSE